MNLSIYHDAGFSTTQMRRLEDFLSSNPLHWIKLNHETGIYELILDNQMMSDYRQCASYFVESHIKGLTPQGGGKPWPLLFGEIFHYMIESYYKQFRDLKFDLKDWAVDQAAKKWVDLDLDQHREHKEYKAIGGLMGFVGLITAYAIRYSAENERLRVIGTEISFGHGKEVLLGSIKNGPVGTGTPEWLFCFLSGRIDLLVDTGDSICPLDHKTMASFRFDPSEKYEMDEGPTGYIYAVNAILPSLNIEKINRSTNKIIMNYISKSIPTEGKERFKRHSIYKTTYQLEAYRLRMLATQEKIFRDLVKVANGEAVERDTSKCNNWFMHSCTYLPIHRQNSLENELVIVNNLYEKKEIWNTEDLGGE